MPIEFQDISAARRIIGNGKINLPTKELAPYLNDLVAIRIGRVGSDKFYHTELCAIEAKDGYQSNPTIKRVLLYQGVFGSTEKEGGHSGKQIIAPPTVPIVNGCTLEEMLKYELMVIGENSNRVIGIIGKKIEVLPANAITFRDYLNGGKQNG